MPWHTSTWTYRAVTVLLPLTALVAFYPARPPAVTRTSEFQTERALAHVRDIAAEPHPSGSRANERVLAYLTDQFRALGLDPQVQEAAVHTRAGVPYTVRNLLVRIPGAANAPRPAIALAAHYDSAPGAPGAGDDAAGVAALLEVARLTRGPAAPRHDLILILSDGEERGMLGAQAFCGQHFWSDETTPPHPWLADIAIVLNFEARGTAGPSVMFETAPGNLPLVRHLAEAAPYPFANSLSYDVYRMLPNDTDFTVFRRAGVKGLNFAFIDGYFHYHRKTDTPENLDPRSLHHHGTYALSLARHFANLDSSELARLTATGHPNAVYFNLTPRLLARYPATWIWPLTAAQILLTAGLITAAYRARIITARGLAGALLRLILALLIAPAAAYGLLPTFRPPLTAAAFNGQLAAVVGTAVLITVLLATEFRRRVTSADLLALALILFAGLSVAASLYLPGGTFVTLWPATFACAALAARLRWPETNWPRTAVSALASLPTWLIAVPLCLMLFTALRLETVLPPAIVLVPLVVLVTWLLTGTAAVGCGPAHGLRSASKAAC
jgi:hypothetical protein